MAQVTQLQPNALPGVPHVFLPKEEAAPPLFVGEGETWEADARPRQWLDDRKNTWETDERTRTWSYHKHDDT